LIQLNIPPKKAKAKTSTQPKRGRGRPKYNKTTIENIEIITNSNDDNYDSGKIEKNNEKFEEKIEGTY
jgi:hypothetical protein